MLQKSAQEKNETASPCCALVISEWVYVQCTCGGDAQQKFCDWHGQRKEYPHNIDCCVFLALKWVEDNREHQTCTDQQRNSRLAEDHLNKECLGHGNQFSNVLHLMDVFLPWQLDRSHR